jgi:hypothetical protein
MPRRSSAELSTLTVFNPAGTGPRLTPPADLIEAERGVFLEIVLACKPNHFEVSDLPLLVAYVRAVISERTAMAESPALSWRAQAPRSFSFRPRHWPYIARA